MKCAEKFVCASAASISARCDEVGTSIVRLAITAEPTVRVSSVLRMPVTARAQPEQVMLAMWNFTSATVG